MGNKSSGPPEVLEYREKFVCIANGNLMLYDAIDTSKAIRMRKYRDHDKLRKECRLPGIRGVFLACSDSRTVLACEFYDQEKKKVYLNEVVVFDKNLKIVKRYGPSDATKENTFISEIQNINYGVESMRHRNLKVVVRERTDICYDRFEETFVIVHDVGGPGFAEGAFEIEVWKRSMEDDNSAWKMLRKSGVKKFKNERVADSDMIVYRMRTSVRQIECGKRYIMCSVMTTDWQVHILDKMTFETLNVFDQNLIYAVSRPVFFDDYAEWFGKSLSVLKGVGVLGRVTVDVLKVILFYVG